MMDVAVEVEVPEDNVPVIVALGFCIDKRMVILLLTIVGSMRVGGPIGAFGGAWNKSSCGFGTSTTRGSIICMVGTCSKPGPFTIAVVTVPLYCSTTWLTILPWFLNNVQRMKRAPMAKKKLLLYRRSILCNERNGI